MNKVPRIVTQADLRDHGLSDYLVRQIVKELDFSRRKSGLRLYATSDVVAAIERKLAKPRTLYTNREKLQDALAWLRGKSNVIKVDFLKNLALEERVEVLKSRIEAADKNMEANVLREYEDIQRRIQAVLSGSKF
jgi:CRISPR/Cas system-associated endonuclease Cas3-HD